MPVVTRVSAVVQAALLLTVRRSMHIEPRAELGDARGNDGENLSV
jgi:hypothetical protein